MFVLPVAGTLAVMAAAGALYLRAARRPSMVEGLAFAWVGGWGIINLALFSADQFLGLRLDFWLAVSVTAMAAASAAALLWPVRSRLPGWRREAVRRAKRVLEAVRREPVLLAGASLLFLFTLFVLFKAVSLPVLNTDGLAYHAVIARDAFRSGSLPTDVGPAWTEWARAFPGLLETQQLWLYLLDGSSNDLWARPLVPLSFGLLALLVAQQAKRQSGSNLAAVVAPLLIVSLPEIPLWSTQLFAEVPVALAALAGAALLVSSLENDDRRLLVLAGFSLGVAGLVKYNGVMMGALIALVGAVMLRARPSRLPLLLVPWAVPVAVILGRNWLYFGNPIYPFFAEVFGGRGLDLLSIFPSYRDFEFARARVFEAVELASALPAVLGLPALVSGRFRGAPVAWRLFLGASLLYLLVYLFFQFRGSHIRYIFPAVPMLAIAGGWTVSRAAGGDRQSFLVVIGSLSGASAVLSAIFLLAPGVTDDPHARWVAGSFAAAALGLAVPVFIMRHLSKKAPAPPAAAPAPRSHIRNALAVILVVWLLLPSLPTLLVVGYPGEERADSEPLEGLGVPSFEQAMTRRFGDDYRMWKWVNGNLPGNSSVVTFDPRVYYIEREVLPATSHRMLGTYDVTLEQAVSGARRAGATHLLDSLWPRDVEVIRPFYERSVLFHALDNTTFFELVHSEGGVKLYRILEGGAPPGG